MRPSGRPLARVLTPALALAVAVLLGSPSSQPVIAADDDHSDVRATSEVVAAPGADVAADELAARREIRLRKLHLVRPDLIPYPIALEVNC